MLRGLLCAGMHRGHLSLRHVLDSSGSVCDLLEVPLGLLRGGCGDRLRGREGCLLRSGQLRGLRRGRQAEVRLHLQRRCMGRRAAHRRPKGSPWLQLGLRWQGLVGRWAARLPIWAPGLLRVLQEHPRPLLMQPGAWPLQLQLRVAGWERLLQGKWRPQRRPRCTLWWKHLQLHVLLLPGPKTIVLRLQRRAAVRVQWQRLALLRRTMAHPMWRQGHRGTQLLQLLGEQVGYCSAHLWRP